MIYEPAALPTLHPLEFQHKWGLTVAEAATVLSLSEDTLRSYGRSSESRYFRNPSTHVLIVVGVVDQKWIKEGKVPPRRKQRA